MLFGPLAKDGGSVHNGAGKKKKTRYSAPCCSEAVCFRLVYLNWNFCCLICRFSYFMYSALGRAFLPLAFARLFEQWVGHSREDAACWEWPAVLFAFSYGFCLTHAMRVGDKGKNHSSLFSKFLCAGGRNRFCFDALSRMTAFLKYPRGQLECHGAEFSQPLFSFLFSFFFCRWGAANVGRRALRSRKWPAFFLHNRRSLSPVALFSAPNRPFFFRKELWPPFLGPFVSLTGMVLVLFFWDRGRLLRRPKYCFCREKAICVTIFWHPGV